MGEYVVASFQKAPPTEGLFVYLSFVHGFAGKLSLPKVRDADGTTVTRGRVLNSIQDLASFQKAPPTEGLFVLPEFRSRLCREVKPPEASDADGTTITGGRVLNSIRNLASLRNQVA